MNKTARPALSSFLFIPLPSSLIPSPDSFGKIGDGAPEPFAQGDGGLPAEELLGARDVGAALPWVVLREREGFGAHLRAARARPLLGELTHGELTWVAD